MKEYKVTAMFSRSLSLAFLLAVILGGCGRQQAQSPFPPTVISVSPANGAVNVPLNSIITATFSSVMNPATLNTGSFTVGIPGGIAVAGTVSLVGNTATFTPATTLPANSTFLATITTNAQDPGGNSLAANFSWTFSTAAPAVISTVPAAGAIAVAINTTVTATFNEVMNAATINAASFTLQGPGVTPVAGVVSYLGTTATFTPAALLAANTLYTATITSAAQDPNGNALPANFVWTFTTDVAPTVVSTIPANGATAVADNTVISATFSRPMDPTTINAITFRLAGPGATPVTGTVSYAGSTATFLPNAILLPNTLYTATITTGAKDPTGNALAANYVWTFTIDVSPTVTSTTPANGAVAIALNTAVTATFSRAMDPTTITTTTFTLMGPGANPVVGAVSYAGTTATFTPTTKLAASTLYTATITTGAKDPTGSALAANYVWTFTTDVPPTVVSTTPANGAINVASNTAPTATFSRAMDPTTITGTSFTVTGPGSTSVAGAVTYAGVTATFTPAAPLAFNTLYTATITTVAADPGGNSLAADYVWTFMTLALPAVTSTDPANGSTNVPLNEKITATFNQPMNGTTILASGTFTVAATGGAAVAGVVTYDSPSNTAIFTPAANLAASTQFTATITTAAQNPGGTAFANNYVWNFTTGAALDATAPTVTVTNPASAAVNVPLNQKVLATFSEAMDPATISAAGTVTVVTTIGAVPVAGTVTYNPPSRSVVFAPTANLAANTQYTATISVAAKDLAGNALIAGPVANPWNFTTGASANAVAPTITTSNPANAATGVPINNSVSATFSAAMDPSTINNASFALTNTLTAAPVSGLVTYDPASHIATFTPSANLAASTQYTATVASSVQDQSGNFLVPGAAANPWSFTTGTTTAATPQAVNLASASTFGSIGSSAGITNQGLLTVVNGDIGTTGASTIVTGFHDAGVGCIYTETPLNKGAVNGKIYTAAPPPTVGCPSEGTASTASTATQALADANTAYNNLTPATLPGGTDPGAGQLGGLTLFPGIYAAAGGSFLITGSDLTLDAQNNPNAVWVFQMASTLGVGDPGTPRNVILINGAQAKNIFWQVGSSATINAAGGGTMVGTIIAFDGITFSTAGNVALTKLNGRALGLNASVTMVNTVINVPAP